MLNWYLYLISALAIALLMVVHECGHFFVARAFGMRVTKFSIGFGPTFFKVAPKDGYFWFTTAADRVRLRLWKHDEAKHGPTVYQVAMIPFLAYVQIAGMNPLEEIDEADQGSYANASLWGRILTIFAGPAANYVFASVFFFAAFFFGGKPIEMDAPGTTGVTVLEGRPAQAAKILTGDRIVEVAGVSVDTWKAMAEVISKHPGETIPVVVERQKQRIRLMVTPGSEGGAGKIGVAPVSRREMVSAREAAVLSLRMPAIVVRDYSVGLVAWARGKAKGELSGPVGMVKQTAEVASKGWVELADVLGMLSTVLGVFNLLPIPALDGGRLMFLGYEATTRRRPNAKIEAHIHLIGLVMMLSLMAWVTVKDVRGPERPSAPAAPSSSSTAAPTHGPK